jgi:hypothetical protein
VLFVPRGLWHTTRAGGESLSLNFTFDQPTWAQLVLDRLGRRLHEDPRWRELADGVAGASPARRAAAARRLGALLGGFRDVAAGLDAGEVIADVLSEAPISDASVFRRRRGARMKVRRDAIVVEHGGGRAAIAIDRDAATFFAWLARSRTSLTLPGLRRRAGAAIDAHAMAEVAAALVAAGALERC